MVTKNKRKLQSRPRSQRAAEVVEEPVLTDENSTWDESTYPPTRVPSTETPTPSYMTWGGNWQGAQQTQQMADDAEKFYKTPDREKDVNYGAVNAPVTSPLRPFYKGNEINADNYANLKSGHTYIVRDANGNERVLDYDNLLEGKFAHFNDGTENGYTLKVGDTVYDTDESYLDTYVPKDNKQFLDEQGLLDEKMRKDYDDYMKNAPEYVSEEEQRRRVRGATSAKTIADLGSLASAFANLYTTDKGAYNQQVAYAKQPEYKDYIDQWTKQRNNYKTYAQKARDYVYEKQRQAAKEKYEDALRDLSLEYQKARIDLENARTTALQLKDAREAEKLQAQIEKLNKDFDVKWAAYQEKKQHDDAMLGVAYARLGETQRHNRTNEYISASKGGGTRGSGNYHIENANGLSVDIPKNNINDHNRSELLRLCGSNGYRYEDTKDIDVGASKGGNIVYKKKKVKMTEDEQWTYITNHMNQNATTYIQRLGGQVTGSYVTPPKHIYTLNVGGKKVEMTQAQYDDFMRRHPSGTTAKPKATPKATTTPAAPTPKPKEKPKTTTTAPPKTTTTPKTAPKAAVKPVDKSTTKKNPRIGKKINGQTIVKVDSKGIMYDDKGQMVIDY